MPRMWPARLAEGSTPSSMAVASAATRAVIRLRVAGTSAMPSASAFMSRATAARSSSPPANQSAAPIVHGASILRTASIPAAVTARSCGDMLAQFR